MREQPDVMLRDIPGFKNYQIGENGEVYNKKTGMEMKQRVSTNGYKRINIRNKNQVKKNLSVHRLLGLMFIPNPLNKEYIDHIDRNKLNNNLENLRWVSNSENQTNCKMLKNNTSGEKGVTKRTREMKYNYWEASIRKNGKTMTKSFPHTDEGFKKAVEWRKQKEKELHKIL